MNKSRVQRNNDSTGLSPYCLIVINTTTTVGVLHDRRSNPNSDTPFNILTEMEKYVQEEAMYLEFRRKELEDPRCNERCTT